MKLIQLKLLVRVDILVEAGQSLNSNSIKKVLLQCFGDKRSFDCLALDILITCPNGNCKSRQN